MSAETNPQAEYFATVEAIAEELAARCKSGDIADTGELTEAIEQDIDGNHYVIHIHAAYDVRGFSSRWGECEADVGWRELVGTADNLDALVCLYAYHAMIADVRDALSEIDGFDPDDDSTWTRDDTDEDDDTDEEE